jgi:uncharacterized protein (TIGR02646 family)
MIRVLRPATPPAVLAVEGLSGRQQHCAAYAAGEREFQFDSGIYGHEDVKRALMVMHHGKCCYCESHVRHISPGTIDHYRPKAASQQRAGDPLNRPGYYWLAYDWENLLFSCPACNQKYKRNQFPLRDAAQRALSHLDSLAGEEPLLIDPSKDNPAEFISFHEEFAFPLDDNLRGHTTIEVLKLNDRPDLVERRRERMRTLRLMRDVVNLMPQSPLASDARQILNEARLDSGEYAAMSRVFLQTHPTGGPASE